MLNRVVLKESNHLNLHGQPPPIAPDGDANAAPWTTGGSPRWSARPEQPVDAVAPHHGSERGSLDANW